MTQNLNHYEKILSRSHSNYLAQISIEMTDANNQINDVLSKLTALGTVLVPMNLITGKLNPAFDPFSLTTIKRAVGHERTRPGTGYYRRICLVLFVSGIWYYPIPRILTLKRPSSRIIGVLVAVACAGFMLTYKLMVSR